MIGRKLDSINRKAILIDLAPIKHRLNRADCNQSFYRIFDRSKIWKSEFFEKHSKLMQKRLKTPYFMNEIHEYEFKSFPKTHEFNLDLPKTSFSIKLSLKLNH